MAENSLFSFLTSINKLLFFVLTVASLSACNTVQGFGKDIEKGGEAIQQSAK
jgi:predicted small secreted protein